MNDAFFIREEENSFTATDHTRGPWAPDAQHAGPPAALLGRAIEGVDRRDDVQVARVTFEILRPIPVTTLTVHTRLVRPGKSVELIDASLSASDGDVMSARAWRIRTADLDLEAVVPESNAPPSPETGVTVPEFGGGGYLSAMETRWIRGSFVERGPAIAWFRMRHPLIDGEAPSPLARVLIAADSGNGISAAVDWSQWLFINPDLTVYLHRMPVGEWVCLDAATTPEESGIGLAASTLFDERGAIGRGLQSLFIGRRDGT